MSVLFHLSLSLSNYDERRAQSNDDTKPLLDNQVEQPKKNFFKDIAFYQIAFLYVFGRLFMTIALVYIPLWLNERTVKTDPQHSMQFAMLGLVKGASNVENIATVPLVSFISSFVASIIFKQVNRFTGHQVGYLFGCLIGIGGCVWVALNKAPSLLQLYLISVLYGAGHSLLIIASLSMTADLIGSHAGQSGAVYAAVTFFDKLLTGIAVFVFESL